MGVTWLQKLYGKKPNLVRSISELDFVSTLSGTDFPELSILLWEVNQAYLIMLITFDVERIFALSIARF